MEASLAKSALMGLVEGLTEFIPVSSTGHLILAGRALRLDSGFAATFEVFIQLGAVLAVVAAYRGRFRSLFRRGGGSGFAGPRGLGLLLLTTLPALFAGGLLRGVIKENLFVPSFVAVGLAVGGLWVLLAERFMPKPAKDSLDGITWRDALWIGVFQCLALWPGMSRSLSTILGGMLVGLERRTATEYSFFAAVPLMIVATTFDLFASLPSLEAGLAPAFAVGLLVSFFSAWLAVRFLIRFLSRHTLMPFGWYRIALALVVWWIVR